jgi:hypothetical protein
MRGFVSNYILLFVSITLYFVTSKQNNFFVLKPSILIYSSSKVICMNNFLKNIFIYLTYILKKLIYFYFGYNLFVTFNINIIMF